MDKSYEWIQGLGLESHPEGDYFKQIEKSPTTIVIEGKERSLYTSIYFLLEENNPSRFHRLSSDEMWYFHEGKSLIIHMLKQDGTYQQIEMGLDSSKGQVLQYCVPKGTIFGSSVDSDYALVSCMVSPGFEFEDFELFSKEQLIALFPEHEDIITKLTP